MIDNCQLTIVNRDDPRPQTPDPRPNMPVTQQNITDWYQSEFKLFEQRINGGSTNPVHQLRRKAIDRFVKTGFPTTRDEDWRFTNTAPLARTNFVAADPGTMQGVTLDEVAKYLLPNTEGLRCVFVDGVYSPKLSSLGALPDGVTLLSLKEAIRRQDPVALAHLGRLATTEDSAFTALQSAFLQDGLFMHVTDGTVLEKPIHAVFFATRAQHPQAIHPRLLVVTGNRTRVSLVESYGGSADARYFTNVVSEVSIGEGAFFYNDILQVESPGAFHVASRYMTQGGKSTMVANTITLGGGWVRNTVQTKFTGEEAECTLNGLALASGEQLVDNHTVIDHATPRCGSHELYKSILDGKAHGVFNGKIFVRQDAQKTDARQTNKTLLLSDEATIDTKPQLEIFADDVKCTHGATVGQLDEDQVFYLRARGIDLQSARDILTFAFAADVVDRVHIPALRDILESLLHSRLQQGRITATLQ
jgi:Fe-S cluster assembly protein SufD